VPPSLSSPPPPFFPLMCRGSQGRHRFPYCFFSPPLQIVFPFSPSNKGFFVPPPPPPPGRVQGRLIMFVAAPLSSPHGLFPPPPPPFNCIRKIFEEISSFFLSQIIPRYCLFLINRSLFPFPFRWNKKSIPGLLLFFFFHRSVSENFASPPLLCFVSLFSFSSG